MPDIAGADIKDLALAVGGVASALTTAYWMARIRKLTIGEAEANILRARFDANRSYILQPICEYFCIEDSLANEAEEMGRYEKHFCDDIECMISYFGDFTHILGALGRYKKWSSLVSRNDLWNYAKKAARANAKEQKYDIDDALSRFLWKRNYAALPHAMDAMTTMRKGVTRYMGIKGYFGANPDGVIPHHYQKIFSKLASASSHLGADKLDTRWSNVPKHAQWMRSLESKGITLSIVDRKTDFALDGPALQPS